MAAAGAIISLVGMGVSMYGQHQAGKAAASAAEWEAAMLEAEKTYTRIEEARALEELGEQEKSLISAQRGEIGGSGTVIGKGTNLVIEDTTRDLADRESRWIRWQADVTVNKLSMMQEQVRRGGATGRDISNIRMAGTLLSTAGKFAERYGGYWTDTGAQTTGGFGTADPDMFHGVNISDW